jgi:hypothetical protein
MIHMALIGSSRRRATALKAPAPATLINIQSPARNALLMIAPFKDPDGLP